MMEYYINKTWQAGLVPLAQAHPRYSAKQDIGGD
jgi:hypothetical protein